jgi:hypothetical protein
VLNNNFYLNPTKYHQPLEFLLFGDLNRIDEITHSHAGPQRFKIVAAIEFFFVVVALGK